MAVFIETQYQKRIGLPAFSSHSYSVTVRSEVKDFSEVEKESAKLYSLLQNAVDSQIVQSGYTPVPLGAGSESNRTTGRTTNGHVTQPGNNDQWACSDRQKTLILKVVEENRLDKQVVEGLAKDMFQKPVKALNKLEASGLIEQLLEKFGPKKTNGRGAYRGARQ